MITVSVKFTLYLHENGSVWLKACPVLRQRFNDYILLHTTPEIIFRENHPGTPTLKRFKQEFHHEALLISVLLLINLGLTLHWQLSAREKLKDICVLEYTLHIYSPAVCVAFKHTLRVTEWQPSDGRGRRTRTEREQDGNIISFAGKVWNQWRSKGGAGWGEVAVRPGWQLDGGCHDIGSSLMAKFSDVAKGSPLPKKHLILQFFFPLRLFSIMSFWHDELYTLRTLSWCT